MVVVNNLSGDEYEAMLFDGVNVEGAIQPNGEYLLLLDVPCGDQITQPVEIGSYILTSLSGKKTVVFAGIKDADYTELD